MKNVLALLFLVFSCVVSAQIINFPDANFKNALVNTKCVDTDGINGPDADADLNNDGEIDMEGSVRSFKFGCFKYANFKFGWQ